MKPSYSELKPYSDGIIFRDTPGISREGGLELKAILKADVDFKVNVYDKRRTPDHMSVFRSPTDPTPLVSFSWGFHETWQVR